MVGLGNVCPDVFLNTRSSFVLFVGLVASELAGTVPALQPFR